MATFIGDEDGAKPPIELDRLISFLLLSRDAVGLNEWVGFNRVKIRTMAQNLIICRSEEWAANKIFMTTVPRKTKEGWPFGVVSSPCFCHEIRNNEMRVQIKKDGEMKDE